MGRRLTPDEGAGRLYVLRKLAAAGKYPRDAAEALGLSRSMICRLCRDHGIRFNRAPNQKAEASRQMIRQGYALGMPLKAIAGSINSTPGAVSVLASKMGLTRSRKYWDRGAGKRGFLVPEAVALRYRGLRLRGLTPREAGIELGLTGRGE